MKNVIFAVIAIVLAIATSPSQAASRTVALAIPTMNCPACPITVKTALLRVHGVEKVTVSYENKEAAVTFDDARTDVETLVKATTEAGYPSTVKAK